MPFQRFVVLYYYSQRIYELLCSGRKRIKNNEKLQGLVLRCNKKRLKDQEKISSIDRNRRGVARMSSKKKVAGCTKEHTID